MGLVNQYNNCFTGNEAFCTEQNVTILHVLLRPDAHQLTEIVWRNNSVSNLQ